MAVALMNERTGVSVADAVELADTRASRRRGLLGRDCLEPSACLILAPCVAVHTAFMRFAIDVVFVDRAGHALKIVSELPPWRIAWSPSAHAVVELAGGRLRSCEVAVGDRLYLAPPSGLSTASLSTSPIEFAERMPTAAAKPNS